MKTSLNSFSNFLNLVLAQHAVLHNHYAYLCV